jgi:outer membrane protein OmpA-like peptidoglycan-associated protein
MRKFVAAMVLATTALSGPVLAKDRSWYIGLEAGPNLLQNQIFDVRNAAQTVVSEEAIRTRHKVGYDVGGNIGYDFGKFRAEFEVAYKANGVDRFGVEKAVPAIPFGVQTNPPTAGIGVPPIGNYTDAGGNARVLSFMANGLFDIGGEGGDIGAVLGGGVGIARVQHANYQLVDGGRAFIDDSDTGVAWQILAGVYKPLSDNVDLGLKYRFMNVDNVDTFTTNGLATQTRYRSHSLMLTLAYNFYTPPAPLPPPPAPVAPAPLPPCPPAAVTPGPFLVFFDWDKSLITAEAAQILDRAAEQFAATGQANVALAGHADTSGAADYNMRLSQRRADAVKAYLAGKGVPEAAMVTEAFGETRLLVETADGVREPQNRRVEITFSGAPQPNLSNCTPQ